MACCEAGVKPSVWLKPMLVGLAVMAPTFRITGRFNRASVEVPGPLYATLPTYCPGARLPTVMVTVEVPVPFVRVPPVAASQVGFGCGVSATAFARKVNVPVPVRVTGTVIAAVAPCGASTTIGFGVAEVSVGFTVLIVMVNVAGPAVMAAVTEDTVMLQV